MKSAHAAVVFSILGLIPTTALATSSTTFWTPATTDIQGFGVLHVTYDSYFTVFKKSNSGAAAFPIDAGLTMGVLPFEKVQLEVGIDLFEPSDYPVLFNAKLGTPEGVWFTESPALNVGIFNVGTKKGVTDQNIGYATVGKTIPYVGRLFAGYYLGNRNVLKSFAGKDQANGFMVGFDRGMFPTKDAAGNEFNRIVLCADYAQGKNAIGGGGAGAYYFFTKDTSLLVGPVWFNDDRLNGKWKWTIQLDVNHALTSAGIATSGT